MASANGASQRPSPSPFPNLARPPGPGSSPPQPLQPTRQTPPPHHVDPGPSKALSKESARRVEDGHRTAHLIVKGGTLKQALNGHGLAGGSPRPETPGLKLAWEDPDASLQGDGKWPASPNAFMTPARPRIGADGRPLPTPLKRAALSQAWRKGPGPDLPVSSPPPQAHTVPALDQRTVIKVEPLPPPAVRPGEAAGPHAAATEPPVQVAPQDPVPGPPVEPAPPLTLDALFARHRHHEGAAIRTALRASLRVEDGRPALSAQRIAALDALFDAAEEATRRSNGVIRGFLDKLFDAYRRGTTWWGRALDRNQDQLVRVLTALLEMRNRPERLQAAVRNARLSTNARSQAVVHLVFWPGWGLSGLLGAVMTRRGIDPNLTTLVLSALIATMGEFGVAVVRHGGVSPVHTVDMAPQGDGDHRELVRFDATWEGFWVRGLAFLPFLATLWYVTYSVHDADATEQTAQRSYQRFVWNGLVATPLVGLWLANAGRALGYNQVNFLPRSVDDLPRLEGTIDALTGTRLLNPCRLLGDIGRGVRGALWSPADPEASCFKRLRSSFPQATTRVRWMARFCGAAVLMQLRPILAKACAHIHPDFGHYAADLLIALAWGFVLETGTRTVNHLEQSRLREAEQVADHKSRRDAEMQERGEVLRAYRLQTSSVPARQVAPL